MGQKAEMTDNSEKFFTREVGPYVVSRNKTYIPSLDHSGEVPTHMERPLPYQIDENELNMP